ncbi:MAG TPA: UbiA family prenyltransferase [Candidatus Azoamicus sp.]
MLNVKKFSIICDLDGRILSFNYKCEKFFCLLKQNVLGMERIYNLVHPNFVVDFIDKLNFFKNGSLKSYKIDVILINSSQKSLVFKKRMNGKFIIVEFFDSLVNLNKSKIKILDSINIIFRSKFTLGSILPFFFSFFVSVENFDENSLFITLILFLALYFFHVAANTFNDYFDWKSGRDKSNVDYVLFSTGGSRAIDLKLISEKNMLVLAILSLFIVFILGIIIIYLRGFLILYLGLIGFFCVYFYSAPPIHLASRYGLGELMHIICLGPIMTYGCTYALTGVSNFDYFILGFPFGFLITCCLLLNEVPDSKFDKLSKKFNLVVVLGLNRIAYVFVFLLLFAFFIILLYALFLNYIFFISIFIIIPYFLNGISNVFKLNLCRSYIHMACVFSFNIYLYVGLILICSLILNSLIFLNPW